MERYFNEVDDSKSLKVLSTKALTEICHQLVDRKDNNAADNLIRFFCILFLINHDLNLISLYRSYKAKAVEYLMEKMPAEDQMDTQLQQFKLNVTSDDILEMLSTTHVVTKTSTSNLGNSNYNNDYDENMDEDEDDIPVKQTRSSASVTPKGGRARGRGGKAGTTKTSAQNNANTSRSPAARTNKHTMPALETSRATVS